MSFLKRLFGGGPKKPAEPLATTEYQGFQIQITPQKEGGQYRLCGLISKEINGETKTHKLVRADMFSSLDEVKDFTLRKAKQVIDEQGEGLFG
jgi:hypothetical protein